MSNQVTASFCSCSSCKWAELTACPCDNIPGGITAICDLPDEVIKACEQGTVYLTHQLPTDDRDCYSLKCQNGPCPAGATSWNDNLFEISGPPEKGCSSCCDDDDPPEDPCPDSCCGDRFPSGLQVRYGEVYSENNGVVHDIAGCNSDQESFGLSFGCCSGAVPSPPLDPNNNCLRTISACGASSGGDICMYAWQPPPDCDYAPAAPSPCQPHAIGWRSGEFHCVCDDGRLCINCGQPCPGGCGNNGEQCCATFSQTTHTSHSLEFVSDRMSFVKCTGDRAEYRTAYGAGSCPVRVGYFLSRCCGSPCGVPCIDSPYLGCDCSTYTCPTCANIYNPNITRSPLGEIWVQCSYFYIRGTWFGSITVEDCDDDTSIAIARAEFVADPPYENYGSAVFALTWEAPSGQITQACNGLHTTYDARGEWAEITGGDAGDGSAAFDYYGYASLGEGGGGAPDNLDLSFISPSTPIAVGLPSCIKSGEVGETVAWPVGPNPIFASNQPSVKQYGCATGKGRGNKTQSKVHNAYCGIFG